MKKTILAAIIIASCFALSTSCQKESLIDEPTSVQRLMLVTEGFDSDTSTKTSVSGNDVAWIGDGTETVAINSSTSDKAVKIEGGKAYIEVTPSYPLFGYYGFKNISTSSATSTQPSLIFPSSFESSFQGGRQKLTLPMVAYSTTEGNTIQFYHVTAAVKVMLRNTTSSPLKLSHVVVSSSTYGLASEEDAYTSITLNDDAAPTVEPHNLGSGFKGSVTVSLIDQPTLPVYNSESDIIEVQVPILPIGASDLTIDVYAFIEGAAESATAVTGLKSGKNNTIYHFSHTAAAPAIARNQMMTAKIQLQNSTAHEIVDNRTFTINASGNKVSFSQGNLMYSNGTWSFHENQYDRCFTQTVATNIKSSITETGTFDLFGWGTSGYNNMAIDQYAKNYQPWSLSSSTVDNTYNDWGYGPSIGIQGVTDYDLTGTSAQYDWGVHNPISNGGNVAGQWRTLTKEEWLYIVNTRQTFPVNGVENARYVLSFINDDTQPVLGLILFPDNYVGGTPEGVTWGTINCSLILAYLSSAGTCSTAGWAALEAAGCVFLPNCGYSIGYLANNFQGAPQGPNSNTGITLAYWSSTHTEGTKKANTAFAYGGSATSSSPFGAGTNFSRYVGLPVRLVKDM